jgi:hypothetical protein
MGRTPSPASVPAKGRTIGTIRPQKHAGRHLQGTACPLFRKPPDGRSAPHAEESPVCGIADWPCHIQGEDWGNSPLHHRPDPHQGGKCPSPRGRRGHGLGRSTAVHKNVPRGSEVARPCDVPRRAVRCVTASRRPPPSARSACSHLPRCAGEEREARAALPDPPPRASVGEVPESSRAVGAGPAARAAVHKNVPRGSEVARACDVPRRAVRCVTASRRPPPSARSACSHLPRWRGGGARGTRGASRSSPTRERGGGARVREGGGGGA